MIYKKQEGKWKRWFALFPVDLHTFDQVNRNGRQPDAKFKICMQWVLRRSYWAYTEWMVEYIPYDKNLIGKITAPLPFKE